MIDQLVGTVALYLLGSVGLVALTLLGLALALCLFGLVRHHLWDFAFGDGKDE